eukprot:scaffold11126_cov56-Attheya_sp.AAC.4
MKNTGRVRCNCQDLISPVLNLAAPGGQPVLTQSQQWQRRAKEVMSPWVVLDPPRNSNGGEEAERKDPKEEGKSELKQTGYDNTTDSRGCGRPPLASGDRDAHAKGFQLRATPIPRHICKNSVSGVEC